MLEAQNNLLYADLLLRDRALYLTNKYLALAFRQAELGATNVGHARLKMEVSLIADRKGSHIVTDYTYKFCIILVCNIQY